MRTLVLGDPHNRIDTLDDIIAFEMPHVDKIIIVGDMHDSWHEGASFAKKTAIWTKDKLYNPRFVILMGNHDAQYAHPYTKQDGPNDRYLNTCGATRSKYDAINKVMSRQDWHRVHLFHEDQGFVYSHAGIHPLYFKEVGSLWTPALGQVTEEQFWMAPRQCWANVVGYHRGGFEKQIGGSLWCDYWAEFRPTPGVKQIFGHSHCDGVHTHDGLNFCVDCAFKEYLVIQDGTPIIYKWDPISKVGYEE